RLWDVASGKEERPLTAHTAQVTRAVFRADDRQVLSGSSDQTLRLWDMGTLKEVRRHAEAPSNVQGVALSLGGPWLVSNGDAASVWDTQTGKELHRLEGPVSPVSVFAFTPDSRQFLTANNSRGPDGLPKDCTVRLWDTETGREVRRFRGHVDIVTCAA